MRSALGIVFAFSIALPLCAAQEAGPLHGLTIPNPGTPRAVAMNVSHGSATAEKPAIDFSPSFAHRLPHHQLCGVVVCQSDAPLAKMQNIVEQIATLQHDLKRYLAIPEANEKIELCIFSSEKSYLDFLEKEFPDAPMDRRALYVKKKGPGIVLVQKTENFEIDLRHEMTHAILHASIPRVPIWLDEGLAKYFEPLPEERAFENPYLSRIRWNTSFTLVPSLERLEKLRDIGDMDVREYRESWAWVHFMIHYSPETHHLLAGYLQHLSEIPPETGKDANSTQNLPKLAPLLRKTLKNPTAAFKQHYKHWKE